MLLTWLRFVHSLYWMPLFYLRKGELLSNPFLPLSPLCSLVPVPLELQLELLPLLSQLSLQLYLFFFSLSSSLILIFSFSRLELLLLGPLNKALTPPVSSPPFMGNPLLTLVGLCTLLLTPLLLCMGHLPQGQCMECPLQGRCMECPLQGRCMECLLQGQCTGCIPPQRPQCRL